MRGGSSGAGATGALAAILGLGVIVGGSGIARAQGNAFLPPEGGATVAIAHTFEYYDKFWVGTNEVSDPGLGRVETGTVTLWMQAGLMEDLAIVANFAYVDVRTDGTAGMADQGLQDRTFLLRYRFLDREGGGWRHTLVGGAGVRLPASGYDPNKPVDLGDGTDDGLFRVVYQAQRDSFWGTYLALEGGYDLRESSTPEGMTLHGEVGATYSRLSLAATMDGLWADGGSNIGDPGFTFPGLDEDWVRLGGNAYYRVSPSFGLTLSGFTTLDGRNTGKSRGMSTALVVQP
jgi:hypothetical protein